MTVRWNRVGWWGYLLVLLGVAVFVARSFVGILVLGLFGYYATRPICDRLRRVVDSDGLAAVLTVSTVLLPVLLVVAYAGVRVVQQLQRRVDDVAARRVASRVLGLESVPGTEASGLRALLRRPGAVTDASGLPVRAGLEQLLTVLDAFLGGALLSALALTLAYTLLSRDEAVAAAFETVVGGPDTTVYAYALAVDEDLESIFFGNLLFVVVIAVVATATYMATNAVAPPGFRVPMVVTLGFLTGVTSLIPIVVGKVVYLPVVAFLGFRATQLGRGYAFVLGTLVAYVLVLDLLPQSVVQPYVTGRQLDVMILLFGYILGPILFGWYGFFLLPILFVLVFEAVRIVLPELVHGEPLDPGATVAPDTGATPADELDDADGGTESG